MRKDITQNRKFLINRLAYFRNQANLSASELSQRLGFSSAYIAKFENGDFSIPTEVLLEALDICGVSKEKFFYENITTYEQDKYFLTKLNSVSLESKNCILDVINNMK